MSSCLGDPSPQTLSDITTARRKLVLLASQLALALDIIKTALKSDCSEISPSTPSETLTKQDCLDETSFL